MTQGHSYRNRRPTPCRHLATYCGNGRVMEHSPRSPRPWPLRYKYEGGVTCSFTPIVPSSSSAPLPLALHQAEGQRRSAAAVPLYAGADARRRPTFPSMTPLPLPLLSATLPRDRISLRTLAAAPPSPAKLRWVLPSRFLFFILLPLCSYTMIALLA
jgi:hypothetical protein